MHTFSQELAQIHQKTLLREANNERMAKHLHQQIEVVPTPAVAFQQSSLSERDFAAIRHDLRSTLSEWCLETGTTNSEMAIDTFMRHLKKRMGSSAAKIESVTAH
jgi:hypothetical protein